MPQVEAPDDRRSTQRIRLRRNVRVTLRGVTHDTHTINVSAGGASVELLQAPERGARGTIELPLTEGAPLNLDAEVRWISQLSTSGPAGADRRHLVGLQFLDPSSTAIARLESALRAEEEAEDVD
jgi:hypothetical protein